MVAVANGWDNLLDDAMWVRARGWALHRALAFLASSADNSRMAAIGRRTLDRAVADDA